MAAGYDGSINIDSRIDTKNFNAGIKQISQGMKSALLSIMVVGMRIAVAFAAVTTALVGAAGAVVFLGSRLFKMLSDSISQTSAYYSMVEQLKTGFNNLKGAFLGAFGTLLNAALPAIMTVVNWLTRMINLAAQFIAALTGQSTYMKYVEGSAEATAKATGIATKNAKDQEKAAKGALAAFDEINVLQLDTTEAAAEEPAVGGSAAGGGPMQFEAAPIEAEVLAFAERVKQIWESIKQWFVQAWIDIQAVWGTVSSWFMDNVWTPVSNAAISIWNDVIVPTWASAKDWFITQIWTPIADAFKTTIASIGQSFSKLYNDAILPFWNNLKIVLDWLWGIFGPMIQNVMNLFKENFRLGFELVISLGKNLFVSLRDYIVGILKILDGLMMFISGVFTGDWKRAWDGIKTIFEGVFMQVKAIVKLVINSIIDMINSMIRGFSNSFNTILGNVSGLADRFGLKIFASTPKIEYFEIPRLATGAVIPPNAEFAAILGDQRSGRNLEAPEDLIRQIVREETGSMEANITINFGGSVAELVRILKPYIDKENVRIGNSLIKGNASV